MLVFDVFGYAACFRRFYSNVTSLSYRFPPRNTVAGLVAAMLGMEKDSYYELFSRKNCQIALSVRTPVRLLPISVNYLDTDEPSYRKFRGVGHAPTVVEFVFPHPPHERLRYRIFLAHNDRSVVDEVWARLKSRRFAYPPSLGVAYCLAEVEPVYYAEDGEVELIRGDKTLPISTVIPEDLLAPNGFSLTEGVKILREERLPPDFGYGRKPLGKSNNYIFEGEGKPINVKILGEAFKLRLPEGDVFGVFM